MKMCRSGRCFLAIQIIFILFCGYANGAELDQDEIDKKCQNQRTNRLSDPNTCSSFIQCMFNTGKLIPCEGETPCFDETLKKCVKTVDCSCQRSQNNFHQLVNTYCRYNDDSWDIKVPAEDCSMFYLCMGPTNDAIPVQCPNGLHYSRMEEDCVSPQQAACQSLASMCFGKPSGYKFPALNYAEYYECSGTEPVLKSCAAGEYFDGASSKCKEDNGGNNGGVDVSTSPPSTVAPSTAASIGKPVCTTENDGQNFKHDKCYKFYLCMNNYAMEVQCGTNQFYDDARRVCREDVEQVCINNMTLNE